jgi:RNA polymerase sigma-70 factor (sigma-E family)
VGVSKSMEAEIAEADDRSRSAVWPTAARPDARAAVAALFVEHRLALVRLAVVMVGDVQTAEDVVQDAFEKLQAGWHRLRDKDRGLAYARSAVLNGCRNSRRRSAIARKHAAYGDPHDAAQPDAMQALADGAELMAAIRALPRRQREVLVLRFYLDLDVAEVAETLSIGPSSVRSSSARALAQLARSIEKG